MNLFLDPSLWCRNIGVQGLRHEAGVVCRDRRMKEAESQAEIWGAPEGFWKWHDLGTLHSGTVNQMLGQLEGHLQTLSSLTPQFLYPKPLPLPEPPMSLSPKKEAPPATLNKVWVTPSGCLAQLCRSLAG